MRYILMLYYILLFMTASVNAENITEPMTLAECYADTDRVLVVAGRYIAKEATSQQLIKDLQDIIKEKDDEIVLLRRSLK